MEIVKPKNPAELAEALAAAASARRHIRLGGAFSKDRMGGPPEDADVVISTAAMRRVVAYDPRDLTISVEAGLPFAELDRITGEHGQMVPLDPPFFEQATIGGVVAANTSGPRRRLYGSCRDLVIGMKFVTLAGKLVHTGGMVVKNVAGLDLAKLMIGSMGTLAAIAVVNLRLAPRPPRTCTWMLRFESLDEAIRARNELLRSYLQPAAIDLLNPPAAARIGAEGYVLLVQAGGSPAVLARYDTELGGEAVEGEAEAALWRRVREFVPNFLAEHRQGAVVRICATLSSVADLMPWVSAPVVARAGTGVAYACFAAASQAARTLVELSRSGAKAVMEFLPENSPPDLVPWPAPGDDFAIMQKMKQMFDPHALLNRGRLYGRL